MPRMFQVFQYQPKSDSQASTIHDEAPKEIDNGEAGVSQPQVDSESTRFQVFQYQPKTPTAPTAPPAQESSFRNLWGLIGPSEKEADPSVNAGIEPPDDMVDWAGLDVSGDEYQRLAEKAIAENPGVRETGRPDMVSTKTVEPRFNVARQTQAAKDITRMLAPDEIPDPPDNDTISDNMGQAWHALKQGAKQTANMVLATGEVLSGDDAGVMARAKDAGAIGTTQAQKQFKSALETNAPEGGDGWMDSAITLAKSVWDAPEGAAHESIAQLPNMVPAMTPMAIGAIAGGVLTAGNPIGVLAGTFVGAWLGNSLLEIGGMAIEDAGKGEYDRGEAVAGGLKKGAFIGALDTATMGVVGRVMSAPVRAGNRAMSKVLMDAGVDVADKLAVKTVMESNSALASRVVAAGKSATQAATPSAVKSAGLWTGATATDMATETIGEYGGTTLAGRDASKTEALMEGLMGLPASVGEVAGAKAVGGMKSMARVGKIQPITTTGAAAKEAGRGIEGQLPITNDELGIKGAGVGAVKQDMNRPFTGEEMDDPEFGMEPGNRTFEDDLRAETQGKPGGFADFANKTAGAKDQPAGGAGSQAKGMAEEQLPITNDELGMTPAERVNPFAGLKNNTLRQAHQAAWNMLGKEPDNPKNQQSVMDVEAEMVARGMLARPTLGVEQQLPITNDELGMAEAAPPVAGLETRPTKAEAPAAVDPMTYGKLGGEVFKYQGTGGISSEARPNNFRPAFLDNETGTVYESLMDNGQPSGVHDLDGLPEEVVVRRHPDGDVLEAKSSLEAGFIRDGQFFTRDEAVAAQKETPVTPEVMPEKNTPDASIAPETVAASAPAGVTLEESQAGPAPTEEAVYGQDAARDLEAVKGIRGAILGGVLGDEKAGLMAEAEKIRAAWEYQHNTGYSDSFYTFLENTARKAPAAVEPVGGQNDGQNGAGSDDIVNDVEVLEPEKNVQNGVQNEGVISEDAPKAMPVEPVAVEEVADGDTVVKTPMPVQKAKGLAPKDQKKYLLKEIDVALEAATAVDPDVPYKGVKDNWKATEILKEEFGTVTIEVPGDGEFTIINTKSHLQEFKKRAKDFPAVPAVSAITLAKKPAPAKSTPTRGRVGGANVEYYNAYKPVPRRAPVVKPNAETVHYQDGYFSDGAYMVAMPEQPKVKTTYADYKEDSFKPDTAGVIARSRKADKPLTIAGELSMVIEGEDQGAKVHLRDTDGNDYFLAADRVDHVMTMHPNARPFVLKDSNASEAAVVFKTLDKVSAVVAQVIVPKNTITERQRERMAELSGEKNKGDVGSVKAEETGEAPYRPAPKTYEQLLEDAVYAQARAHDRGDTKAVSLLEKEIVYLRNKVNSGGAEESAARTAPTEEMKADASQAVAGLETRPTETDGLKSELRAIEAKKEKTVQDYDRIEQIQWSLYEKEQGVKQPIPYPPRVHTLVQEKRKLEDKEKRLRNKINTMGPMVPFPIKNESVINAQGYADRIDDINREIAAEIQAFNAEAEDAGVPGLETLPTEPVGGQNDGQNEAGSDDIINDVDGLESEKNVQNDVQNEGGISEIAGDAGLETLPTTTNKIKVKAQEPWEMTRGEFESNHIFRGVNDFNSKNPNTFWGDLGKAQAHSKMKGVTGAKLRGTHKNNIPSDILFDDDSPASPDDLLNKYGEIGSSIIEIPSQFEIPEEGINDPHRYVVKKALSEGRPVPPEVLRGYPDLQSQARQEGGKSSDPTDGSDVPQEVAGIEIRPTESEAAPGSVDDASLIPPTEEPEAAPEIAGLETRPTEPKESWQMNQEEYYSHQHKADASAANRGVDPDFGLIQQKTGIPIQAGRDTTIRPVRRGGISAKFSPEEEQSIIEALQEQGFGHDKQVRVFEGKDQVSRPIEPGQGVRAISGQFPTNPKHFQLVKQAIADGKPVPPEVLKGYPDLMPKAAAYVEPQPGDTIRFTPHDTKYQVPVEGIVRESINNGDGFHVFTGGKEDPRRVDRIWKDKGRIEILKPAADDSQAVAGLETRPTNVEDEFSPDNLMAEWDKQAEVKNKAAEVKQHLSNAMDKFKQINALFGDRGSLSGKEMDENIYAQIKPLLQEALNDILKAGQSAKEFVGLAIENLSTAARPYFERFVRGDMVVAKVEGGGLKAEGEAEAAPAVAGLETRPTENLTNAENGAIIKDKGEITTQAEEEGHGRGDQVLPASGDSQGGMVSEPGDGQRPTMAGDRTGPDQDVLADESGTGEQGHESELLPGSGGMEGQPAPDGTGQGISGNQPDPVVSVPTGRGDESDPAHLDAVNYNLEEAPPVSLTKTQRREINDQAKALLSRGGPFTDSEKNILRQYTGEGGLGSGQKESLNQHYTDYPTISAIFRAVFDAVKNTGFVIKKALEPSVGSGNFVGMRPDLDWTTVDIDATNHAIVQALYPKARHYLTSFENLKKAGFDLVVSNVPFLEQRGKEALTNRPDIKALHDFYFVHALDRVRDNGIVAFITSRGTMDKKSDAVRREVVGKADILAAFRLPGGHFEKNAHTSVITDVIFMQKRPEGAVPSASQQAINEAFVTSSETKDGIFLNNYYHDRMENMLGTVEVGKDKARFGDMTYKITGPAELSKMGFVYRPYEGGKQSGITNDELGIKDAGAGIAGLETRPTIPTDSKEFFKWARENTVPFLESARTQIYNRPDGSQDKVSIPQSEGFDRGIRVINDSNVLVLDQTISFSDVEGQAKTYKPAPIEMARKILTLQRIADHIRDFQLNDDGDAQDRGVYLIERYQKEFKTHPAKDKTLKKLMADAGEKSYFAELSTLFKDDFGLPDSLTTKTRYTGSGQAEVTKDSPLKVRAFAAENSKGMIRLSDAPLIDKAEVEALLTDGYAMADHGVLQNDILYYSGNIYQKIADAVALRETVTSNILRAALDRQMAQLENLKPSPKSIDDIRFKGKEAWAIDILRRAGIRIDKFTDKETGAISYNYYGPDAYERYLNNKQLVTRGKDEGTASFMERVREAEEVVAEESARIRDAVKARPELLEAFELAYNSRFRNYVQPVYDQAAYLVADVLAEIEKNSPIRLRKNQVKWLVQAVYEGKGINAHDVGGGKTFASISLARALKRRGAAKKPMFVVPAKTIKKWERDIKTLFPDAKIVNLGKLAADTRTKQLFELSHTNADYVLISHEGFAHLQLPKEKEIEYVNALLAEHIDDPTASGREAAKIDDDIDTMRRVITESQRDTRLTFDKLGIDMIVADEAHNFKNIGVRGALAKNGLGASFGIKTTEGGAYRVASSTVDKVTELGVLHPVTNALVDGKTYASKEEAMAAAATLPAIPATASLNSARSYDFRFKANYITDTNNGNNVFLLTATPTPNKPMEIYTMLRHLSPTVFHEYGIQTDKDFADQFFDIGTVEDRSKGKPVNVLRAIVNAIDLRGILYRFVDKVRMEEMPWITVPEETAMRHFLEQSMGYAEVAEDLKRREQDMPSRPGPGDDRTINLYTAGRAASVDPRLYGDSHAQVTVDARSYESTDDKIQFTIENVAKIFRKDKTSGQLIFLDAAGHQQASRGAMAEDLHSEMKRELVALGFDPKEIAIINGKVITNPNTGKESASGDKDQRKQDIADAYNAGKIKVILGTTASMGEGMDLQVNTTDIWHVDIPFKPGDIRQRNGRGVRYGNKKGRVNTHYLLMKGTFDAMSFDLVLKKKGWNEAIWDKEVADVISTEEEMTGGAMPRRQQILIELETDPVRKAELMIGFRMDQLNEERRQALQADYHVRSKQLSAAKMIEDAETVLAAREKALAELAPDMEIEDEKERQTHFNRSRGHLTRNIAASHKRIETLKGRRAELSPKAEKAAADVAKATERAMDFESRFLDQEGKVIVPAGFNVAAPRFFADDPVADAVDDGKGFQFQNDESNYELGITNDELRTADAGNPSAFSPQSSDLSFWDAEAERVMQHVGKAKVVYEHEADFVANGPAGAEGKKAYIDSSKPVPEIHVNLDREDKTSVFHEYAHLGVNRVRAANPAFIEEGIRLAGGSEEKLVQAIAEKGKNITDRENRSKFLAWLDKLYASVRRMMKKTFRVEMGLDDFVEVFAYRLREKGGVERLMGEGKADAARAVAGFETRPTMGVAFQGSDASRDNHIRDAQKNLKIEEFEGTPGNKSHITRTEEGMIDPKKIKWIRGAVGEIRGEHRNMRGNKWEAFKKDILENGMKNPITIFKDPGEEAVIHEGNHRLDAAIELGLKEVPVDIRYFGHSEQEGLVYEPDDYGVYSPPRGIQFQADEADESRARPAPTDHRPSWLKRMIENHPGVKLWDFLSKTGPEWAGEKSDIIDKVNSAIITGYREDAAFSRLRKDHENRLLARRQKAAELARVLASFPAAEQARLGQIIEGSITMAPKRYAAALKTAEEFMALEKELQELGLLGEENRFRQMSKKEIAAKFKEIGEIAADILKKEAQVRPIVNANIQRRANGMAEAVARVIAPNLSKTALMSKDIQARIDQAFTKYEADVVTALMTRGLSEGEAMTIAERIRKAVGVEMERDPRGRTDREAWEIISRAAVWEVTAGLEKIKPFTPENMAGARAEIVKELRALEAKKSKILERIQTHYKMSGKQYLRMAYDTIENDKAFLKHFKNAMKYHRLRRGYEIQRKDYNEMTRKAKAADLAAAWRAENPGKALDAGVRAELDAKAVEAARREWAKWKWDHRLAAPLLAMKGMSEEAHDAEMMRLFKGIAENPEWSASEEEMKDADAGNVGLETRPTDRHRWKQLAKTDKLGPLAGRWVRPEIYDYLDRVMDTRSDAGKLYDEILRLWKTGKVVFNPAAQMRNIMSNILLANMAGVGFHRVDIYMKAAKEMKAQGKEWKAAEAAGLFGVEWAGHEITSFLDGMENLEPGSKSIFKSPGRLAKTILAAPGKSYQAIEQYYKFVIFVSERGKGKSVVEAKEHSEKWLFNYTDIPSAIRWARRWYSPFITFTYKAMPRFVEISLTKPWKMAEYWALMAGVELLTRTLRGESDDDQEKEKKVLPAYMRREVLPGQLNHLRIPFTDEYGRSKYLDLSYILPWGDVGEQWGQSSFTWIPRSFLPSHPMIVGAAEIAFNEVLFTGEELRKSYMTNSDYAKALGANLWRQVMPSLAPGGFGMNKLMAAATGDKDWAGRDRSFEEAIFDTMLGMKVRSIDYTEERGRRMWEFKGEIADIKEDFRRDWRRLTIQQASDDPEKQRDREADLYENVNERVGRVMEKVRGMDE